MYNNSFWNFQFALMLEYCPNGNLRSYLIDHETEFRRSLKHYTDMGNLEADTAEGTIQDAKQLCVWACQV